ncbi:UDP-glucose 4-epimerase GalE [Candidatus Woesearchaeota archaeon]|nr:MAG: UDP-glucose 4-epimerase GalE [Candidatus Woesearchaeota archaeon]
MVHETILVVGGAGYIGSHTVKYLLEKGYNIIVYDSLVNGHEELIDQSAKFYKGCLSDEIMLEKVFSENKIDAVIDFAGFIEAGESMKRPLMFFENNVGNCIKLLRIMLKFNVNKIIFSSTAAVYGVPKKVPITEDDEKKPINYYGETKLMFEQVLNAARTEGLKSIKLRYFNAAGAWYNIGEWHNPETHLIPLVINTALGLRESIKIFGVDYDTKDGTCVRDYVHVVDLAKAHELALRGLLNGIEGEFNVGTGKGYSVKEVIDTVKRVTGKDFKIEISERREGDPAILVASPEKFFKTFGWMPEKDLNEIVSSAWSWHKTQLETFKKK